MKRAKKCYLGVVDTPKAKKARDRAVQTFIVNTGADGRTLVRRVGTGPTGSEIPVDTERIKVLESEVRESGVKEGKGRFIRRGIYETKNKGRGAAYRRLQDWVPKRDMYLDQLLALEGPGDGADSCCSCQNSDKEGVLYRCTDCLFLGLLYPTCLVDKHRHLPYHRVESWNGAFFEKASLCSLGLHIQLGHDGAQCPLPVKGPKSFVVVSPEGYHFVHLFFCGCIGAEARDVQLLQARLFPASADRPSTAFTFGLLDMCEELALQGKTNVYDTYTAIVNRSGKDGKPPLNKYKDLCFAIRMWRHLLMLKRAGRGHDPTGANGTKPGELCVECPCCPHPGRNLPPDWMDQPFDKRWLYTQYLAEDANFKLALKDKGLRDIELAPGWAYFVEENAYQAAVTACQEDRETNTCRSQHNAILAANTRGSRDYKATGTGAVVCGRHSLICKNGVGDLQRGKRYANMDYIALSVLKHAQVHDFVISYDIACQWSKHFKSRISRYPAALHIDPDLLNLRVAIPKFHLPAHGPQCQTRYSLNYLPKVGRTYGEGVESSWVNTNGAATSTREMAPGVRHETLNDFWGAWNWKKVLGFGDYLLKQLNLALKWKGKHRVNLDALSASIPAELIKKWRDTIEAWYQDPNADDPFSEPNSEKSLSDVRKQFAEEDAAEAKKAMNAIYAVSARTFLINGLDIEERQRMYRITKQLEKPKTDRQATSFQNSRTHLLRRIINWRGPQDVYMPLVAERRSKDISDEADDIESKAENVKLFLPSDEPKLTSEELCTLEYRLRRAQADDALEAVRQHLRSKSALRTYRRWNVYGTGNKANTRAQDLFNKIEERINIAKGRYHAARSSLKSLRPDIDWDTEVRDLKDNDVRGPEMEDEDDIMREEEAKQKKKKTRTGTGFHDPSWIWLAPGANATVADSDSPFRDSVRVQWARAYARVERWDEELQLVCEEMRRVLAFFIWKSNWWLEQSSWRQGVHRPLQRGLHAYAARQSAMYLKLAHSFARQWYPRLRYMQTTPTWLADYEDLINEYTRVGTSPKAFGPIHTASTEKRATGLGDGEIAGGDDGEDEDEDENSYEDEDSYDARESVRTNPSDYFVDDDDDDDDDVD